jgi:predicted O-linked N-acetylglucosamine transferase (SPINDLY family)
MASAEELFARAQQAHRAGAAAEAMRLYRSVLRVAPRHLDACYLLGTLQATSGDLARAALTLQKAAALAPRSAQVQTNLGLVYKMLGRAEQAEQSLRQALAIDPDLPQATNNLAALLIDRGLPAEAEALARRASNSGPDASAYALVQLANAQADQARTAEAIGTLLALLQLEPEHRVGWGNFLSFLHYDVAQTPAHIFKWHCQWGERFVPAAGPDHADRRGGRLRIAYLSPDFLQHPVGELIEPVIVAHDMRRFDIFLYSDTDSRDGLTERLRAVRGVVWRDVAAMSDTALAEQVRADGIDILVELAGHLSGNRLPMLAMRAAPVQVSYPATPGRPGCRPSITQFRIRCSTRLKRQTNGTWSRSSGWIARHFVMLPRPMRPKSPRLRRQFLSVSAPSTPCASSTTRLFAHGRAFWPAFPMPCW